MEGYWKGYSIKSHRIYGIKTWIYDFFNECLKYLNYPSIVRDVNSLEKLNELAKSFNASSLSLLTGKEII